MAVLALVLCLSLSQASPAAQCPPEHGLAKIKSQFAGEIIIAEDLQCLVLGKSLK